MRILVITSGSSSIKYQLFDIRDSSVLTSGFLEWIGEVPSRLKVPLPPQSRNLFLLAGV